MPGWGTGSFDNEHAQTWLGRLPQLTMDDVMETLRRGSESDYLEAPEAGAVIAAGEIIAAASGSPADHLPPEISDWISQFEGTPSSSLRQLAAQAIEKVRKNSELRDLWHQAEGLNEWSSALRDLSTRLSG